jgi:hypothetical protein
MSAAAEDFSESRRRSEPQQVILLTGAGKGKILIYASSLDAYRRRRTTNATTWFKLNDPVWKEFDVCGTAMEAST